MSLSEKKNQIAGTETARKGIWRSEKFQIQRLPGVLGTFA